MRKLQNLSTKECGIYYKEIVAGANDHWHTGNFLASNGKYHHAIGHLILSTEELVKGMAIHIDSKGFSFRKIKGFDAFFRNHELRYLISFFVLVIGQFGKDFLAIIRDMRNGKITLEQLEELLKELENKDDLPMRFKFYFFRKYILLSRELEWFSNVKALRENSMYSDYHGKFKSPLYFTKSDYQMAKEKLKFVRMVVLSLLDDKNDESISDSLKLSQERLDKLDAYNRIGEVLKTMSHLRLKPFDFLKKGIGSLSMR